MSKILVSIIIPTFEGIELLKKNLPLLFSVMEKQKISYEVIVVDNGSTDGSVGFIKRNYPQVSVIRHKYNKGFSPAITTGYKYSKGKYLVLLNNDVVPKADFLIPSLKHFADNKLFAVSFHEEGYGPARGEFIKGFLHHLSMAETNVPCKTFWVSGGSGVFSKEIWRKLKGFDETLFAPFYWEDLDLSYRALKRGYKILWEPTSFVDHEHESTSKKLPHNYVTNIKERNELLFIWKNITSDNLFKQHLKGLLGRVIAHPGYLKIVLLALGKLSQVRFARKKEKSETIVSDEAIFAYFA